MVTTNNGISKRTIIAGLFVSIIPSSMDIFGKIILDEFDLPFLSIVADSVILFTFVLLLFLYTNILCSTDTYNVTKSPFWISTLFMTNITRIPHLKCILCILLLSLFWSGNCIFTYLATLCDVPSFVGMLKGFVTPSLLFVSWLFGGKEQLTILKVFSIFMFAIGEIMIDCGEVSFNTSCLFLATIAVICTTGKYFMIEKVMCCKLPSNEHLSVPSVDPYNVNMERDQLIPSVDTISIQTIEMIHLNAIENECNTEAHTLTDPELSSIDGTNDTNDIDSILNEVNEDLEKAQTESIPSLLVFAYILPPQIIIGIIVFVHKEYQEVVYNETSDSYASARNPWFWYSRLIQNSVFLVIYWAEIHLVGEYSALYMMVFGAIRNVATLILSWIIFNYRLTVFGWIGYLVAIIAVSAFQYAKQFDNHRH